MPSLWVYRISSFFRVGTRYSKGAETGASAFTATTDAQPRRDSCASL